MNPSPPLHAGAETSTHKHSSIYARPPRIRLLPFHQMPEPTICHLREDCISEEKVEDLREGEVMRKRSRILSQWEKAARAAVREENDGYVE